MNVNLKDLKNKIIDKIKEPIPKERIMVSEYDIYRNYKEGEGIMKFSRKVLEKLLKEHPKTELKIIANNEIIPEYWDKACDCSIDSCIVEELAVFG